MRCHQQSKWPSFAPFSRGFREADRREREFKQKGKSFSLFIPRFQILLILLRLREKYGQVNEITTAGRTNGIKSVEVEFDYSLPRLCLSEGAPARGRPGQSPSPQSPSSPSQPSWWRRP